MYIPGCTRLAVEESIPKTNSRVADIARVLVLQVDGQDAAQGPHTHHAARLPREVMDEIERPYGPDRMPLCVGGLIGSDGGG